MRVCLHPVAYDGSALADASASVDPTRPTRDSGAGITEVANGLPDASGGIPPENGRIQQILARHDWNTSSAGRRDQPAANRGRLDSRTMATVPEPFTARLSPNEKASE